MNIKELSRLGALAATACLVNAQTNQLPGNPVIVNGSLGIDAEPWAPLTLGGAQPLGVNVYPTLRILDFDFNGLNNGNISLSGALYRIDLRPGQPVHQWWTRSAGAVFPQTTEDARMVILENGNVGIGTSQPTLPLDVNGSIRIEGINNGIAFGDGSVQTTAIKVGPQGPSGPQGPQGPPGAPVHTSAVCVSNAPIGTGSGCRYRTVSSQSIVGGSCNISSDTGSCSAAGSSSAVVGQVSTAAVCSVCAPN